MLEVIAESPPSAAFDYDAWAAVYNAAEPQAAFHVSPALVRKGDADREASMYRRRTLGKVNGEAVACGVVMHMSVIYDPKRLWVWVSVAPQWQGRGMGRAMYDDLLQAARADVQPNELVCRVKEDSPVGYGFLTRRGFVTRQRTVPSILTVADAPAPDPARLTRLAAQGVEVMSFAQLRARDPDWRRKLWELRVGIELRQPSPHAITPLTLDQFDRVVVASPALRWGASQVAVLRGGGPCVGLSEVFSDPNDPSHYKTGITGTHMDYVRRGVATALKQAAIQCAAAEGARTLSTENASTNPMLAINTALGFKPLPAICVVTCAVA
jgi:GNAT superfamily N-acetyltransferase